MKMDGEQNRNSCKLILDMPGSICSTGIRLFDFAPKLMNEYIMGGGVRELGSEMFRRVIK